MTAIILSAGSELIAAHLAEEFKTEMIPFCVIHLGEKGILKNLYTNVPYAELEWPPLDPKKTALQLLNVITNFGASKESKFPIFATEDGGLRLLFEYKDLFNDYVEISGAFNLKMGGLDKAELHQHLTAHNLGHLFAPSYAIKINNINIADIQTELGDDFIIKPALKPFSMELSCIPSKILRFTDFESDESFNLALQIASAQCSDWIAQSTLVPPPHGEAVVWSIRDEKGTIYSQTAVEIIKYDGTGCVVEIDNQLFSELAPLAKKILDSINFVGACEIPFLKNKDSNWQALELNPRPWLQFNLCNTAQLGFGKLAYDALTGNFIKPNKTCIDATWINIERYFLHCIRTHTFPNHIFKQKTQTTFSIYSTKNTRLIYRWIKKIFARSIKWQ